MKIVKSRPSVMNASRTSAFPVGRILASFPISRGPGRRPWAIAEATIPPRICATESTTALRGLRRPVRANARDTAGLKRPPEIRQKRNMVIIKEIPNEVEM